MKKGYIKLHRRFFEHALWEEKRNYSRAEAFLDMIQTASFKASKRIINGKLIQLDAGELIASERYLSVRWGWSRTKIRKFVQLLKEDGMLDQRKDQAETVLNLLKYKDYAVKDGYEKTGEETEEKPDEDHQETSEEPGEDQTETKVEEGKEREEGKKGKTREEIGENLSEARERERLLKLRCGKLFSYTERRSWDKGEKTAWQKSKSAVKSTTEEEWQTLEAFHALPTIVNGEKTYKRTGLQSTLNNWNSEITKAVEYFKNNPADVVDDCPAGDIARCFNETLGGKLDMIAQPTDKRRAMVRAAWKYPVIGQDFENIKRLFSEVKRSKFLMGKAPGSNFKASYDWIFGDEDRIVRIMEGQFRDEKR